MPHSIQRFSFLILAFLLTSCADEKSNSNSENSDSHQLDASDVGFTNIVDKIKNNIHAVNNANKQIKKLETNVNEIKNEITDAKNTDKVILDKIKNIDNKTSYQNLSYLDHTITFIKCVFWGVLALWSAYCISRFIYYFRTCFINVGKLGVDSAFSTDQQQWFTNNQNIKLSIDKQTSQNTYPNRTKIAGGNETFILYDHFFRHPKDKTIIKTPWRKMPLFLLRNSNRWGFSVSNSCELAHPNLLFRSTTIELISGQSILCNPNYIYAHESSVIITGTFLNNKLSRILTSLPLKLVQVEGPGKIILGCEGGLKVDSVRKKNEKTIPVSALVAFTGNIYMKYQADKCSLSSRFWNVVIDGCENFPLFKIIPFLNIGKILANLLRYWVKPVPKDIIHLKLETQNQEHAEVIIAQLPCTSSENSGARTSSNSSLVNVSLINT